MKQQYKNKPKEVMFDNLFDNLSKVTLSLRLPVIKVIM